MSKGIESRTSAWTSGGRSFASDEKRKREALPYLDGPLGPLDVTHVDRGPPDAFRGPREASGRVG